MFAEVLAGNFQHGMVPYGGRPVYLRLVDTRTEAKNYAAGGFHVSVIRGSVGGCADPALGFAAGGTDPNAFCKKALDRNDLSVAWDQSAEGYKAAYDAYVSGASWQDIKAMLVRANALADLAYKQEGVDPPRDPGPSPDPIPGAGMPDPVGRPRRRWGLIAASAGGLGLVGLLGVIGLSGGKGKGKGSKKRSSKKSARRGSASRYM